MDRKIMMMAIGVAGVLLTAGLLVAIGPILPAPIENEKESKITMPKNETVQMGTANVIDGQLSDQDGKAIASETVSIDATLPDGSSGGRSTVFTDNQGKFSFAITPVMVGQYNVSVNFGGNANCKPSTYTVIIVVIYPEPIPIASTTLSMSGSSTVQTGSAENITGLLKSEDGAAISWAAISIQVTNPDGSKRAPSTVTTGTDGKFSLAITPTMAGEHTVFASYGGNVVYSSSSSTFSFKAEGTNKLTPVPPPVEPNLNIAYLSGTYDNEVYYGMPSQRSGPYPGWEYQYPADNEFRIETNGYGPDQPDGPTKIALFIQVDGIGSRWVGSNEIPEGTVEVRTFPENAYTPRLVNLFNDGAGNCKGILVNSWSVYDYSFVYEPGVTDRNLMTFSLDITKLGDYNVKVWAVHDHGDGTAVQVSNTVNWTVHVNGEKICSIEKEQWTSGGSQHLSFQVKRSTQPDDDNVNLMNTVAYTGTVGATLWVQGIKGYTVSYNGVVLKPSASQDGYLIFSLDYKIDFSGSDFGSYYVDITVSDGQGHDVRFESWDHGTGQLVGTSWGYVY